jgi:hypothetical protein
VKLVIDRESEAHGYGYAVTVSRMDAAGRRRKLHSFVFDGRHWWPWNFPGRRNTADDSVPLENRDGTVFLADGVNPAAATLAVVLSALHSDGRNQVDLGDVKVVLSQLGSRIRQLNALDGTQRRHAQQALCVQILRRCTTL